MSSCPLVSVLMVTYNHEIYIEAAIRSVFMQDYTGSIQFVIGNDCSTDKTGEIIEKLILERSSENIEIVYLKHESNLGGVSNFNECLRKCSGEIIVVCDGDDLQFPSRIRESVNSLIANNNSLCVCNAKIIDEEGVDTGRLRYASQMDCRAIGLTDIYTQKVPVFGAGYTFKRDLIIRFGLIDPAFVTYNNVDQILFWRAVSQNGVGYLHQAQLWYREHRNGASLGRLRNRLAESGKEFASYLVTMKVNSNILGNLLYVSHDLLEDFKFRGYRTIMLKCRDEIDNLRRLIERLNKFDIDSVFVKAELYDKIQYDLTVRGLIKPTDLCADWVDFARIVFRADNYREISDAELLLISSSLRESSILGFSDWYIENRHRFKKLIDNHGGAPKKNGENNNDADIVGVNKIRPSREDSFLDGYGRLDKLKIASIKFNELIVLFEKWSGIYLKIDSKNAILGLFKNKKITKHMVFIAFADASRFRLSTRDWLYGLAFKSLFRNNFMELLRNVG